MSMIITTTNTIETHEVSRYLGIVSSQVIVGTSIKRDFIAFFSDITGKRSPAYESVMKGAKYEAMGEMKSQAQAMGANAILGVHLSFDSVGEGNMMMVTATGTAVVVE